MKRVIVVGSSNTDMVVKTPKFPLPGETLLGGSFAIHQGGKGANQAVAAARAGANVTFIACVGDDNMGKAALDGYQAEGIDISMISADKEASTGVAVIMVDDASGQNSIVVTPGANARLSINNLDAAEELLSEESILLAQLEVPIEVIQEAFVRAQAKNMRTILNPAPARALPDELLKATDIITPNESETELITGVSTETDSGIKRAAEKLLASVREAVIITLGSRGSYYMDHRGTERWIDARKVANVEDTTAAGDVFNGYLAALLLKDHSVEDALHMASAAAAISVTREGAQPSIPYFSEI